MISRFHLDLLFTIFAVTVVQPAAAQSLRLRMEQVMGPLPSMQRGKVPVREHSVQTLGSIRYIRLDYEAEPGDWVPAWLLVPETGRAPRPAALALHQTTKIGKDEPAGLGGNPTLHYGRELAERGYIVLVPDYPSLGENRSDPYRMGYASTSMKGIWNHIRGIDLLTQRDDVDARRIAAVGHSLGGHNALFLAVFDPRVRGVVSSCGFTSFARYRGGDLTGWSGWRYMPRIATEFGKSPARMPFDFPDILEFLRDRRVFINAPIGDDNFDIEGARECMRRAGPRTVALYPEAGHEFPAPVREQAYRFLAGR